jgi:hypothetical protein
MKRLLAALSLVALAACGPTDQFPEEGSGGSGDLSVGEQAAGATENAQGPSEDVDHRTAHPVELPEPGPPVAVDVLAGLPACEGGVMAAISLAALQPPKAGSNTYRVPGAGRLVALESSIVSLLHADAGAAKVYAATAEYSLCRGTGAESTLALWRAAPGEGQARIVLRTGPSRGAILEAPHPLHDSGTLEQARDLFTQLGARALVVSGTHRCANAAASGCSGTTAVCDGKSGPFRVSDMAHTEQSAYHAAHRALAEHFTGDWVVAIHGMGDAGVSVSDGTKAPTVADSPSAKVASALAARTSGVTTCNAFPGSVPWADRLCGSSDVQGRHVNGAAPACTQGAPSGTGRFIHLEQSKAVRTEATSVRAALDEVLPAVAP